MLLTILSSSSVSHFSFPSLRAVLITLALGWIAAVLCTWLRTPLPWMIGPLFATAIVCVAGGALQCPMPLRQAGQWVIGTTLGLYFTPPVLKVLGAYVGFIVAAVVFALLLGALCAWLLHRLSGVDKTTAFFAMAIGGASEMANQGERHGAAVDRVAAAHSLRIMLVVAIIPFGFQFWGVHGLDPYVPGARIVDYGGLLLLTGATSAAAWFLLKLKWPNAWVIGPLLVSIALTANGVDWSAMPDWLVHLGQLFIGISLGTRFTPEFLRAAPRYLGSVAVCGLLAIVAGIAFGLGVANVSGIHPATAILSTSPGGIAEMSLTAKTLQLGVPIVTAFHVTRMAALVLTIGPAYRLASRLRRRSSAR